MKIAAIFDIHGNLPALEAVLAEIRHASVDEIIVGGDVLPGPQPIETLECLFECEIAMRFLTGNGENDVLAARRGEAIDRVPEAFRDIIHWTAEQITDEQARRIAAWPAVLQVQLDGIGDVLFCHATSMSDNAIFTRLTPEDRVRRLFAGVDENVIVCGHTHMPFDRRVGTMRIINAGSVGMPFGGTGADWLLLGPNIELRHTDYSLQAAAERIRATDYPQAAQFADAYVLNSPSEEPMLAAFGKADSE